MMIEDEDRPVALRRTVAASDNGTAGTTIDVVVLTIARLIGRQIAREEFERRSAASDDRTASEADEK